MEGVHGRGWPGHGGSEATQHAGFRRVGVNDVGAEPADLPHECGESAYVATESDRPPEAGDAMRLDVWRPQFQVVGFPRFNGSGQQPLVEPLGVELLTETGDLESGTPDVHTSDDAQDADAVQRGGRHSWSRSLSASLSDQPTIGFRSRLVNQRSITMPAMRVLVTGGAGYIGSHLVDSLCEAGHEVRVLDNLSTGNANNLRHRLDEIGFVNGSILDASLVEREVEWAQMVFHLAASVGVRHIVDDPLGSLLTNTRGTENLLSACHRYWCKVLVASTSEVYGKTSKVPMVEDDDRVLGPTTVHRWSYSTAKAIDEHLAFAYGAYELPIVIVRYFNSYGPRLDEKGYGSVVANFLRQALAGEPLSVHGDGQQSRCFTYIDDTIRGTLLAGSTPEAEGMVFNLGGTRETTVLELAEMIRAGVGSNSEIAFTPYDEYYGAGFEDTRRRVPDVTRARETLGWDAEVPLEDGLQRTIEWWQKTHV